MTVDEKLSALRNEMKKAGVSAWIVPGSDPHNTEYTPTRWKGRQWISGFSGSAGTIVVTLDAAGLWADGRYHIQAPQELAGTGFTTFKVGLADVPTPSAWLAQVLKAGDKVGFDAAVMPKGLVETYNKDWKPAGLEISSDKDLLDLVWQDRPEFPAAPIWQHTLEYAGYSSSEKIEDLRSRLRDKGAESTLVTALDDVAWLANFRGSDVRHIPVAMAFAYVSQSRAIVFIDAVKVPESVMQVWQEQGIEQKPYEEVKTFLAGLTSGKILVDPISLNWQLTEALESVNVEVIESRHPVTEMKSVKNAVELKNYHDCHVRDGVAVVRFMKWLEERVPAGGVLEHVAAEKLEGFRKKSDLFIETSFNTIPGYGPNGALMHYSSSPEKPVEIGTESFLLVDSGGQYPDGTTDITRTFCYGEITEQMRRDYTLVAKAVINLTQARFMKGASPCHLDVLARGILWQEGINYGCGTGHGVGICLKVHEAPHNFGVTYVNAPLEPGVVITNEPGIYREGVHGVRIENILCVVEDETTDFGTFYKFETMTLAPIDTRALDLELLGDAARQWLNNYHERVFNELSPSLETNEVEWLRQATASV